MKDKKDAFWIIRSVIFCIVITSIEASYSIDKTEVNLGQTKYKVKTQKYKLWKDTTYNPDNVTWPHLFPEACNTTLIECGRLCFNTTGCCGFLYKRLRNPNCFLNDIPLRKDQLQSEIGVDFYEVQVYNHTA